VHANGKKTIYRKVSIACCPFSLNTHHLLIDTHCSPSLTTKSVSFSHTKTCSSWKLVRRDLSTCAQKAKKTLSVLRLPVIKRITKIVTIYNSKGKTNKSENPKKESLTFSWEKTVSQILPNVPNFVTPHVQSIVKLHSSNNVNCTKSQCL